jgi:hypothetical protein
MHPIGAYAPTVEFLELITQSVAVRLVNLSSRITQHLKLRFTVEQETWVVLMSCILVPLLKCSGQDLKIPAQVRNGLALPLALVSVY